MWVFIFMEIWKDIEGFENYYQVSNKGNIRSLERLINFKDGRKRIWKGVLIKGGKTPTGYEFVCLRISGKKNQQYIHRLVAKHFIPNPENKPTVNHIDGNKSNNSIDNLEWNTCSENSTHAMFLGLSKKGTSSVCAKLSYNQVLEIRKNKDNLMNKELAIIYSVSITTIGNVLNLKKYKEVV